MLGTDREALFPRIGYCLDLLIDLIALSSFIHVLASVIYATRRKQLLFYDHFYQEPNAPQAIFVIDNRDTLSVICLYGRQNAIGFETAVFYRLITQLDLKQQSAKDDLGL